MLPSLLSLLQSSAFWKNVRLPQLFFLSLAGCAGMSLALSTGAQPTLSPSTILPIITLFLVIALGWTASCTANDAYDVPIDRISNPRRPLPLGLFPPSLFIRASWIVLGMASLLAPLLPLPAAGMVWLFLFLNVIYNVPPLRLKRFPFVGTLVAAAAFQSLAYAGFFLLLPAAPYPYSPAFVALFVVGLMLVIVIKDFKDIDGDRAGGIMTLPLLLGPVWSRLAVLLGVTLLEALALWDARAGVKEILAATVTLVLAALVLFASRTGRLGIAPHHLLHWMMLPVLWQILATLLFFP